MLVLFIDVPPSTLDVNVTPDKRTVFLYHEKEVFAKLRATLLATFSSRQGNCPTSSISSNSTDNRKRLHKPLIQWKNSDGTIQIDQQQAYISSTQLSDESDHLRIFDDSLECNHLVDDVQSNNSNGDIEETITTNSDSFMEEENSEKSKHTAIHQPISRIGHKIDDPDLQQTPNKRKKGSEKSDAVSRSSIRNSVMKTLEAYSFQRLKSDAMNSASKALQTPNIELEPILKSSQSIEVANEIIYDERPHAESQLTVDDKNEFDFPANTSQMCEDSSQSNFSTFRPQQVITLDFESLQENFLTRYGEQRQTDETQLPVTIATSGDMIGDEQGPDKAIAEEAKKQAEQHLSLLLK
jgi:DNA mismatch repair ATPase MutL